MLCCIYCMAAEFCPLAFLALLSVYSKNILSVSFAACTPTPTRTISPVFAFKVMQYAQSDTVNQDLYLWTINHSRNTVWGHVPQVPQWHDVPCLWGLRCGYLRLMSCCIYYMPGSHALWKVIDFFDNFRTWKFIENHLVLESLWNIYPKVVHFPVVQMENNSVSPSLCWLLQNYFVLNFLQWATLCML